MMATKLAIKLFLYFAEILKQLITHCLAPMVFLLGQATHFLTIVIKSVLRGDLIQNLNGFEFEKNIKRN